MRIQAKVLYDEIKKNEDGIYIWLTPDELSTLNIMRLLQKAPFKTVNSTDLHCTVLYCTNDENTLPNALDTPVDARYEANIVRVDTWQDHKGRTVLVLALDSPELTDLHDSIVAQGFEHGYPDYNPHITIATKVELDAEARLWVGNLNLKLMTTSLPIVFSPQLRGSSIT